MIETIQNVKFMQELFLATIRMATPLLLVALGELFSERAGLINIGLDGIMTISALSGFLAVYIFGGSIAGLVVGIIVGILINFIYAFCTITLKADQIVNGMALNILAPALATFIYRLKFGLSTTLAQNITMKSIAIPVLSEIPFIGKVLFNHNPVVYLAYFLVPIIAFYFNKTKSGLNFKAVGEYPRAAESVGINVISKKYLACVLCGALAGLGGAYLTVCYIGTFADGLIAGRGFIALSAVIFGRWTPSGILIATLLFGFADALQLRLQLLNPDLAYQLLAMLPYIFTLTALVVFGSKKAGPKSLGKPYFRE